MPSSPLSVGQENDKIMSHFLLAGFAAFFWLAMPDVPLALRVALFVMVFLALEARQWVSLVYHTLGRDLR